MEFTITAIITAFSALTKARKPVVAVVVYCDTEKKTWQYICDHNSGKPRWILISFAYLKTGMNALFKQSTYLFYM